MPKFGLVWFFLLFSGLSFGQNLAQNPGLEETPECPLTGQYDFFYKGPCKNWTCPKNGTSDYYSSRCAFGGSPTTTNNSKPHEGLAFGGFYYYGHWGAMYNREYLQGKLTRTLTQGASYRVSFWVKPVNADRFQISAGIQEIGIYFSANFPNTSENLVIETTPQVENKSGVINDTSQWTEIIGCFTATGNEQVFTIGNFHKDEDNTMQALPGATQPVLGYMLFDDLKIEEISSLPLLRDSWLVKCELDTLKLETQGTSFQKYLWNHGPNTPVVSVTEEGWYYLKAINDPFCSIQDSVYVENQNCKTCNFFIPTSITPDENDINDGFQMVSDCEPRIVQMQIFSRWGDEIFNETSKAPRWDGSFYGKTVADGVYIYKLQVFYEERGVLIRKNLNGTVTLLR